MTRHLVLVALWVVGCGNPSDTPVPPDPTVINVFELSDSRAFPDGIALAPDGRTFYVGGALDGTIYRGFIDSVAVRPLIGSSGPAGGLVVTADSLLAAAGATTGRIIVHDLRRPGIVRQVVETATSAANLRAVALGPDGAIYATDAKRDSIYMLYQPSLPGSGLGAIPLDGKVPYSRTAGAQNLTGLVAVDGGRWLIAVHHDSGKLFRIDPAAAAVEEISVAGPVSMVGADGLMFDRGTLYVAIGRTNQLVPVTLSDDFLSGTVGNAITDTRFRYPTNAVRTAIGFLVVNSQRDVLTGHAPLDLPFTVRRIPLPPRPATRHD